MYKVAISKRAKKFLEKLSQKDKRICYDNLSKLSTPYPGRGNGDKEQLVISGEVGYRLHISRKYTAFYQIKENTKTVLIIRILTIKSAHKKYGF